MTPVIAKKREFYSEGCKIRINGPKRRYYNKINSGKPMYPYSFIGFLGRIELRRKIHSKKAAQQKLSEFLEIEAIGRYTSEGMGLINWISGKLERSTNAEKRLPRVKIRQGLPQFLPLEVQRLIQVGILHDFFNTTRHGSKIYVEPKLEDLELTKLCRNHHGPSTEKIILQFQKYDRLAARMTRRFRSPRVNRYTWSSQGKVDFVKLAEKIAEINKQGVWKLYKFIHENKELEHLNESLEYGHSSVKRHLLLIGNLIVRDYLRTF
ncbi:MAG: hypothetical protein ACE5OZ_16640 [Candidatus Heimdallarchaeota archaeon]